MTPPVTRLFLAFALVALVSACRAEEPLPFTPEYAGDLMARVNGDAILKNEVLAKMGRKIEGIRNVNRGRPEEFKRDFLEFFDRTLISMVSDRVVSQKAKSRGFSISDEEVESREREIVRERAGGDREKWKEMLAQSDLTMTEWHELIKAEMTEEVVLSSWMDNSAIFVQPGVALAYFNANPGEFQHPERVKLRVLCFRGQRGSEDRALRLADSLRRQVEAGADFAGLTKWSDSDVQRDAPVDLEWRTRKDLEDPLADAVFKASEGTIVGPVKGESGIYLARVEGREEARKISFEDAQKGIMDQLRSKRWREQMEEATMKLMSESVVEFKPEHLRQWFELQKERREGR
ncbi:MAG: peptidyl-prolyl cis-trans isomerase [Planctomycetota bacterium]|nr:MAG: peptidyl-prolyl cis-trans isomerase [Planctomycetota bacterium]